MAIPGYEEIKDKPNKDGIGESGKVYIDPKAFKTATIVDIDTPMKDMVTSLEGRKWSVDYFNQVKSANDIVAPLDVNLPDALASYNRIENFTLYVTAEIDPSSSNIEGEAKIVGITPSQGDMFKVGLSGARDALMRIEEVRKVSYNLSTVYIIGYKLYAFLDTDGKPYKDLLTKTIKSFISDRDHQEYGNVPILLDSKYKSIQKLRDVQDELVNIFIEASLDYDLNMFMVPKTDEVVDPFLEGYFFAMVDTNINNILSRVHRVTIDDYDTNTIYDALLDRNKPLFKHRFGKSIHINLGNGDIPMLKSISYLGIKGMTMPFNSMTKRLTQQSKSNLQNMIVEQTSKYTNIRLTQWRDIIGNKFVDPRVAVDFPTFDPGAPDVAPVPIVPAVFPVPLGGVVPVVPVIEAAVATEVTIEPIVNRVENTAMLPEVGDHYLFSKELFNLDKRASLSHIERLVLDYLDEKSLEEDKLLMLLDGMYEWSDFNKFYYIPVVMMLTRYHIYREYTEDQYNI